jgi:hypothetical protein
MKMTNPRRDERKEEEEKEKEVKRLKGTGLSPYSISTNKNEL